jgi:hypothetical protein
MRHRIRLACFALHFFIIVTVCCRDTSWVFSVTPTLFPQSWSDYWRAVQLAASTALGQELALSNPIRSTVRVYAHAAGIEAGYGFFAPNVPNNYKLVFELHYPDRPVEYELPRVSDTATGARLTTLLDHIAETQYDPLREMLIKMLTYSVWQDHPDATRIRAVLGYVNLPTPSQFEAGKKESYEFLYAYDFTVGQPQPSRKDP